MTLIGAEERAPGQLSAAQVTGLAEGTPLPFEQPLGQTPLEGRLSVFHTDACLQMKSTHSGGV